MALRVLLADDEKEFVETLAERLDLRGIEVRVALDGKAALTTLDEMAAAEALPDVMVVDLLMPGMTGDAVLQQVRQKYPGLPVIVLTGHDSVDDSGDSPVASAFACLTKPLSLGMFITYGIVRRLGGEITVDSTEGKGTTVSITLPLTPPERPVEA